MVSRNYVFLSENVGQEAIILPQLSKYNKHKNTMCFMVIVSTTSVLSFFVKGLTLKI